MSNIHLLTAKDAVSCRFDLARIAKMNNGIAFSCGFTFPVVPKGEARIRVQLSAEHTDAQIDRAVAAFATVGKRLGILKS